MKNINPRIFILLVLSLIFISCARKEDPLKIIVAKLAQTPEYSIILNDIKKEGMFSKSYYHKYKIVQGDKAYFTKWLRVSENSYRQNENFLGMTLASKTKDGQKSNTPYPPGYQYVGNKEYGNWRQDSRGNSFWEFYGKYALFSSLFGFGNRSFYRNDYNRYRSFQGSNRPYFGSKNKSGINQFGTNGSLTKRTNPTFYERRMAKQKSAKSGFSNKVNKRFGGSRTTFGRGRGGFGK